MGKFTAEEKLQAALRYLNGKESYKEIIKSIDTDYKSIVKWVKHESIGAEAFVKQYTKYTQQFKIDVLNFILKMVRS